VTDRRCLTPKDFATSRRISLRTVYRLIKSGKLPAERVGNQWRLWMKIDRTTSDTYAKITDNLG